MARKVSVLTVTYGDREKYVSKLVSAIQKMENVQDIIIVWNGNYPKRKQQFDSNNIHNIYFSSNMGSARAFSEGLKFFATQQASEYVWMLDDDNLPDSSALSVLLKDYEESKNNLIFSSFRKDRVELKARGYQRYQSNSFFEFSISQKLGWKNSNIKSVSNKMNLIQCETVPYGGLLLPRTVLKEIGYPNKELYLYSDDNEFTYRMTKLGMHMLTDTHSLITDMEQSWYRKNPVPMFKTVFTTTKLFNACYTIRNRVFFEKHNIVTNKFLYLVNIMTYLIYVFFFYMPKNKAGIKRMRMIIRLIKEGWTGRLGQISNERIQGWN